MLRLFLIIALCTLALVTGTSAFAQQLSIGEPPDEDISVKIDSSGNAHVVQEVKMNKDKPTQVETIKGNMSNFAVTDEKGSSVQYSTISQTPRTLLILPADRNYTLIKYDLDQAVSNNNGLWTWDYFEPSDTDFTDFYFPHGVDMIWANDRPVYLADKGLRQHGNGMHLSYIINEPSIIQQVKWEDKTFNVEVRTLANVGPPVFDQSSKAYAFNVDQPNSFITIIMPQELLWGPYKATINTNKTLTNEFHENGTHAWIGIRPSESGTVQITGTTAIPEFPFFVPLVIAISAVVLLRFSGRIVFH